MASVKKGSNQIGVLGDIHGSRAASAIMNSSAPMMWLSVGDLAGKNYEYFPMPKPLYFIAGNNDDFEVLEKMQKGELDIPSLNFIPNARLQMLEGVRVLGLGGTYARNYYHYRRKDLPFEVHKTERESMKTHRLKDKRRHYVEEEVEACKAIGRGVVDIFLTHESPYPFTCASGRQAGRREINDILYAIRPRLHFFGHHHRLVKKEYVPCVPSIGLPKPASGYALVDIPSFSVEIIRTGNENQRS